MKRPWTGAVTALCLILCTNVIRAEGITLVNDGVSDYVIVLGPKPSPSEHWAAEELASHIKQMSGTTLKVQQGGPAPARAVVLGFGSAADALGVKADETLGEEGYVIRTVGANLVIAGGQLRGTMYGVYTLLEKLGVRWWTPAESTIPDLKTIQLPELNVREVPRLAYRDMMGGELWSPDGKLWMARNRLNGMSWESGPDQEKLGGRYEYVGKHFLHGYNALLKSSGVPIKEDMWSLVDGKRLPDTQPCLTNPEVVAAVAASVIRELKKTPRAKFVAVSHEEKWFGYCQCEKCAALAAEEGPSGLVVQFANRVAEVVEREIPGGRIATAAYGWSCNPPKTLKPRDNVIIAYDPISCDYAHPLAGKHDDGVNIEDDYATAAHYRYRIGENKRIRREIDGWSKITRNLILYDYTASIERPIMPYPDLDVLASNVKYYADHGFTGIFAIGSLTNRGSEFYGLRTWVLAKALWNPDADGPSLLAEFLKGYYGPAAPAIQNYIDIIHKAPRERSDCYLPFNGTLLNSRFLRPEIIAAAEQALQAADKAAAGNPDLESRVRHAHMPIWYMLAKRGPASVTWKLTADNVGKIDLRELAKSFTQVVKERGGDIGGRAVEGLGPPFMDWLNEYAQLTSEKGRVVPPELRGVDGRKFRVIQACQMDSVASLWRKTEGASDGWCEVLEKPTFAVQCGLTPGEEYVPDRKYKLFVRVKGEGKIRNGVACVCRVYSAPGGGDKKDPQILAWQMSMGLTLDEARKQAPVSKDILAEDLADGQFHAVEIAEVVNPTLFDINIPYGSQAMAKVSLDCFWLVEVLPDTGK